MTVDNSKARASDSNSVDLLAGANAVDLTRKLSWIDGGALAIAMQTGVIASLGYTIGAVGALGALAVWGAATLLALLQNHFYAEMALMFPEETGGISLFAHQAWRRYSTFVGPLASFGYW